MEFIFMLTQQDRTAPDCLMIPDAATPGEPAATQ